MAERGFGFPNSSIHTPEPMAPRGRLPHTPSTQKQNSDYGDTEMSMSHPIAQDLKSTYFIGFHHFLGHSKDGLDVAFSQFVCQLAHRWVVLERGRPVRQRGGRHALSRLTVHTAQHKHLRGPEAEPFQRCPKGPSQ